MPTYEYACTSCERHIEVVQSFTEEPLAVCPHCDGPLRKVFGAVGIVLKGSGFYKTDSRAAASSGAARSSTAPEQKDGTTKDGTTKDGAPKEPAKAKEGGGTSTPSPPAPATSTS